MILRGTKNPPTRKETTRITLTGEWHILSKTESEFKIHSCVILLNGKDAAQKTWRNRTVRLIQKENGLLDVSFVSLPQQNKFDLLLRRQSIDDQNDVPRVTQELNRLFVSLFAQNETQNLTAILGPDCDRKAGEIWIPETTWIQTLIAKQQISNGPADWKATALYSGIKEYQGEPRNEVIYRLVSDHIPGYDLKLDAVYHFPFAGKRGSIHIAQNAVMVVDHILPEENPVFSGTAFNVVTFVETDLAMFPKK